jgi:hypothetical protein
MQVSNRLHHEVWQQLVIVSDLTRLVRIAVMVSGVNQKTSVTTDGYDADDSNSEDCNGTEIMLLN